MLPLLGGVARAEIALLANGQTLKLDSHRLEDGQLVLQLRGRRELELSAALVQGFVPDEVIEELAREGDGRDVRELASEVARRHGLPPELVLAVVSVESGFQPQAVSPKGAQGLMQLMPGTASALGVEDAFDPEQNLDGGIRHLGSLLVLYGGDVTRALAAYNAGQGAVAKYKGVPPYAETRAYVKKVLSRYGSTSAPGRAAQPGSTPARRSGAVSRRPSAAGPTSSGRSAQQSVPASAGAPAASASNAQ